MELQNSSQVRPIPVLNFSSPCCSSIQRRSHSSSDSSIEYTKNCSSLGPTRKKWQVRKKCREVSSALDSVSEKYHETIANVLGNSFLYRTDEVKENVGNTISEVVDLVMKSSSSKKGLSELLSPKTHASVLQSMRVPDWVYFNCILNF